MAPATVCLKVVLVGDSGVGKTSLIEQFVHRRFAADYKATIGADFYTKSLSVGGDEDTMVSLQLWDTAGQERFQSLTNTFYRGADICIIVHDITEEPSVTQRAINRWKQELIKHAPPNALIAIFGNKQDLIRMKREQQEMAANDRYFECSAKTGGPQLEDIFRQLAEKSLACRLPPQVTRLKMATRLKPAAAQSKQSCNQC